MRTLTRTAAAVACLLGLGHAATSAYWALGGTALLDTIGGSLERWGRQREPGLIAALWLVVVVKVTVAVAAPVLAGFGARRLPRWTRARVPRLLGWVAAIVLIGYGGLLTAAGLLVEAGLIEMAPDADRKALVWHTYLWDPWFLLWGLAFTAVLWTSRRPSGQGVRTDERIGAVDELVALVDDEGRVCGSAPRSVVRRDNLRHSATGVMVRNSAGDIYVHRRTSTKDVYPGRYDFMAGGVVGAGEEPYDAVRRELAEELGISGAELVALPEGDYSDEHTAYHAYLYSCVWDGPIRHQPEEVEWGAWMSPAQLLDRLADPDWPFVPDTSAMLTDLVRELAS